DAALRAAVFHERALQRVAAAEPFDRRDARALDVRERDQARVHRHAVDENGARTALAFSASFLRPRETAVLPEHAEKACRGMRMEAARRPVKREATATSFSGVGGTARRSSPGWRSALTTAGAGPSIGISPTPFAPNGPCGYGLSSSTTCIAGVSSVVGM